MKKEKVLEKDNKHDKKKQNTEWQKPCLEDVSGKIMAQPYIRFT